MRAKCSGFLALCRHHAAATRRRRNDREVAKDLIRFANPHVYASRPRPIGGLTGVAEPAVEIVLSGNEAAETVV